MLTGWVSAMVKLMAVKTGAPSAAMRAGLAAAAGLAGLAAVTGLAAVVVSALVPAVTTGGANQGRTAKVVRGAAALARVWRQLPGI